MVRLEWGSRNGQNSKRVHTPQKNKCRRTESSDIYHKSVTASRGKRAPQTKGGSPTERERKIEGEWPWVDSCYLRSTWEERRAEEKSREEALVFTFPRVHAFWSIEEGVKTQKEDILSQTNFSVTRTEDTGAAHYPQLHIQEYILCLEMIQVQTTNLQRRPSWTYKFIKDKVFRYMYIDD